jgi:pimeloyl-ACP methyl ester carboxylesterase
LHDAVHIGHSTGGGEVVRYPARHGESRAAEAVLISAVPPGQKTTIPEVSARHGHYRKPRLSADVPEFIRS